MIFMHYFLLPARICCCKFYTNLTGKGISTQTFAHNHMVADRITDPAPASIAATAFFYLSPHGGTTNDCLTIVEGGDKTRNEEIGNRK